MNAIKRKHHDTPTLLAADRAGRGGLAVVLLGGGEIMPFYATHGEGKPPSLEFRSWSHMMTRCYNPISSRYADWGGRGIRVCERWMKYENFLADMGRRPTQQHSLDRIDNDKDYGPSNCKWSTPQEQCKNRRKRRWWKRPQEVAA